MWPVIQNRRSRHEIAIVTGMTGIGKTHVLKPITEDTDEAQYIDLINERSPEIKTGTNVVVIDHADAALDTMNKIILDASDRDLEAVFLVGQDLRDFCLDERNMDVALSVEMIGGFADMRVRITHDGVQSVYTRDHITSISQLIH